MLRKARKGAVMRVRGVEIKKGDKVRAFHSAHGGYWQVVSLRPFIIEAHQCGERWQIQVTPTQWVQAVKSAEAEIKDGGE